MQQNEKGRSVFAREKLQKGDFICTYEGELCTYKELHKKTQEYMLSGAGSYILEFKFQEKWWGVDATKDNCSIGHLINHSTKRQNIKPVLKVKEGKPVINFIALRDIDENEELLYDYSDNSKVSKTNYPGLAQ